MPATEVLKPGLTLRLPEERLFAFAAQWEAWNGPDGEVIQSRTMLTTAEDAEVEPVNDRMPLVLTSKTPAGSILRILRLAPVNAHLHEPANNEALVTKSQERPPDIMSGGQEALIMGRWFWS